MWNLLYLHHGESPFLQQHWHQAAALSTAVATRPHDLTPPLPHVAVYTGARRLRSQNSAFILLLQSCTNNYCLARYFRSDSLQVHAFLNKEGRVRSGVRVRENNVKVTSWERISVSRAYITIYVKSFGAVGAVRSLYRSEWVSLVLAWYN